MIEEHDDGLRSSTRRARVVKVDDSRSQQFIDLSGLKNEMPKKIWRPQDFGYTSVPPKDSDGIIDQMGSRSDRTFYRDGGHEKYRPKNTPGGCAAIFNQYGDIIRVFKDNADVVHQKQINIRIGHGYAAGQSGDSGTSSTAIDDQSSKDTTTISFVATTSNIVVTFDKAKITWDGSQLRAEYDNTSAEFASGQITLTAPKVVVAANQVHLGADGGLPVKLCDESCATKVFAT
jgi:phage gp45-like